MAFETSGAPRLALIGVAVAGALAGSAGGAAAQYYDDGYGYGYGYAYGYREPYRDRYAYGYAPLPPAPIPRRAVGRVAVSEYGLTQVDRTVRTRSSYVVDGKSADGSRMRLIFDAASGELVDRVILKGPAKPSPRLARVDPRDGRPASPRLTPRPPERPPVLKPPVEATAPAQIVPPAPAMPPRGPEPVKPATAPAEAKAPATTLPVAPARPPAPTQGPANPATGAPKPILVNPNDVRGAGETERTPPLAKAESGGVGPAPVKLPPVQLDDPTPLIPPPETPAVPVMPLD